MPEASAATPTSVLERISLVLDAFDDCDSHTLGGIIRATGLPRSSAHRILEQMVKMRWLRRDGRHYSLGMRMVELGSNAVHQNRVHAAASLPLHQLYRATGMTVHLGVLDGDHVVYLDKVGARLGGVVPTRVGGRLPARHTALGRALLAYAGVPVPGDGGIREQGVAVHRDEALPGLGCIACPVGPVGHAVAAVSICGPVREMTFDARMVTPVRLAAAATWRALSRGTGASPALQRRNLLHALPTASTVRGEVRR